MIDNHSELFKLASKSYHEVSCKVNEVECLVSTLDDIQVVAFRGTEGGDLISGGGVWDVLRDIRFIPWYDKRVGWSHAGFLKGARGVVDKGLYGMLDRDVPIDLTGHSLGGVLAINAAAILRAEGFNVRQVITFGAPRTLTAGSLKRYIKTGVHTIEYSNKGDPIPDFPSRWWGYRHVNEQYTSHKVNGYSIANNHLLEHYGKVFDV